MSTKILTAQRAINIFGWAYRLIDRSFTLVTSHDWIGCSLLAVYHTSYTHTCSTQSVALRKGARTRFRRRERISQEFGGDISYNFVPPPLNFKSKPQARCMRYTSSSQDYHAATAIRSRARLILNRATYMINVITLYALAARQNHFLCAPPPQCYLPRIIANGIEISKYLVSDILA